VACAGGVLVSGGFDTDAQGTLTGWGALATGLRVSRGRDADSLGAPQSANSLCEYGDLMYKNWPSEPGIPLDGDRNTTDHWTIGINGAVAGTVSRTVLTQMYNVDKLIAAIDITWH